MASAKEKIQPLSDRVVVQALEETEQALLLSDML